MKEIVERRRETIRNVSLQQPHVVAKLSLFVMILVLVYHTNKLIELFTRELRIILADITTYVGGNFGRVKMSNKNVTEVVGKGNVSLVTDTKLVLRMLDNFWMFNRSFL